MDLIDCICIRPNLYVFYNAGFFCHLFYVNWKMKLLFKVSKHNAFRLMQKCIIHMRSPIIITIDFIVRVLYTFIVAINFAQNNDLHTWNFLTFAQWWPEIPIKGGFFFRKYAAFFKFPKQIFQMTILSLKFEQFYTVMGGTFKFHVQDRDLDFFEICQTHHTFWKKSYL